MAGLGPIHVFLFSVFSLAHHKTWMAGPRPSPGHASPAMTMGAKPRFHPGRVGHDGRCGTRNDRCPLLSSRYSAAYRAAGRRQPTSVRIALRCSRRHTSGSPPHRQCPQDRRLEHLGLHRRELEAGGDAGGERHLVGVDHRVGQAADAGDDRHAAVAQAVELGQAAGLEARRHEDRVAAALDQVRQRLVVADDARRRGRDGAAAAARKPASSAASPEPSSASCAPRAEQRRAAPRAAGRCPSARSAG